MENQTVTVQEGKTPAIISHLTWIGTIVAYFMNKDKNNPFVNFYIRQNIGLNVISIVGSIIARFIGIAGLIISIFAMVLWIISFLGMLKGEEKKVPLLGDQFQEWFKNI